MKRPSLRQLATIAWLMISVCQCCNSAQAQGILLPGVGPVNRSMGGATTAAPIDAIGSLYWNPAAISGFVRNEMSFGGELLLYDQSIASRVDGDAPSAGTTHAEPGAVPIPSAGWIHKPKDSLWTFGLGMYEVGGFRLNYAPTTDNPILSPQGEGGGLGRLFADSQFVQIAPTLAYAISERLGVGFAPVLTMGQLSVNPLMTASAGDAGALLPPGQGTRWNFGGGFQVGVYFMTDNSWHFGASYKSPQWMEEFRYFTDDGTGDLRVAEVKVDLPSVVSLGTAFSGIDQLLVAIDIRYFGYGQAAGFGDKPDGGKDSGLGWNSLFSMALGAQYQAADNLYLRVGYTFQQNPIKSGEAYVNVATPLIQQHLVSVGGTWQVAPNVGLVIAYVHGFRNSVTGPWQVPDLEDISSVTSSISSDALTTGLTVYY